MAAMFLCFLTSTHVFADVNWSFSKSKELAKEVYLGNETTFYCACDYEEKGNKLVPDWKSCGYFPRNEFTKSGKRNTRSVRIEWEHVMPAWLFGNKMECWRNGGRKACKKDKEFEKMEADLHNLVPAIGEINGDRSNFTFSNIKGEKRAYGKCDFEVDFKSRTAEPRVSVRGDIARIYFYMSQTYDVSLSKEFRQMLVSWSELDPVDAFERARDNKIYSLQGNKNPFVGSAIKNQGVEKSTAKGRATVDGQANRDSNSKLDSKIKPVDGYSLKSKNADDF